MIQTDKVLKKKIEYILKKIVIPVRWSKRLITTQKEIEIVNRE